MQSQQARFRQRSFRHRAKFQEQPQKGHCRVTFFPEGVFLFTMGFLLAGLLFISCSFDYSAGQESERSKPDITMEEVEYVRVRGGDMLVRFQAEYAERWEESQIMEFKNFVFEQMEDKGETINAEGRAGAAVVQTDSGDISMSNGVRIDIKSEDIIIRTAGLEWKDKEKHLLGSPAEKVEVERTDGTSFIGWGFSADARNRTWAFSGKVEGTYVETDDEDEDKDSEKTSDGAGGKRPKTEWVRSTDGHPQAESYSHEEIIQTTPDEK